MKKNRYFGLFIRAGIKWAFTFGVLLMAFSCNESFPRLLTDNYPDSGTDYETGRVLYIIVDGMSGAALKTAYLNGYAPNIQSLSSNSSYSFSSLADAEPGKMTSERGWANLLTGVYAEQSGVEGNSLENLKAPSFLSLLKESDPGMKTSLYASSSSFYNAFKKGTDRFSLSPEEDSSVKDAVINELTDTTYVTSDVIVAQFHGVEQVEKSEGYFDPDVNGPDSPVIAAIRDVDDYIGDMIGALQTRPNYGKENWLVIISSNYGGEFEGTDITTGSYDDKGRNTFTLMYNSRFSSSLIQKPALDEMPYSGYGVRYTYEDDNYVNATLRDPSLFNLGSDNSYTIQFMFKDTVGTYGWPTILSKRKVGFSGQGWNIFLKGDYWSISSSKCGETNGTTISDGKWHVLTVVFHQYEVGEQGTVRVYTDGVFDNENTLWNNSWDLIDNNIPLRIGRIPSDGENRPDLLLTNLQIYNVPLSDSLIATLSCISNIDESHPYYDNLIGYWVASSDEVGGNTIKEKTGKWGNKADFVLTGPYSWRDFSDNSSNVCPPAPESFYKLVPNSVDLPFQILQWLGVSPNSDWDLKGKGWTPVYSILN